MTMRFDNYQRSRFKELGFPVGTGKRYSRADLQAFIGRSEEEEKLKYAKWLNQLPKNVDQIQSSILEGQMGHNELAKIIDSITGYVRSSPAFNPLDQHNPLRRAAGDLMAALKPEDSQLSVFLKRSRNDRKVLTQLLSYPDGIRQSELAKLNGINPNYMAERTSLLLADGLVKRVRVSKYSYYSLTELGDEIARAIIISEQGATSTDSVGSQAVKPPQEAL